MKTGFAAGLMLCVGVCFAQAPPGGGPQEGQAAYPESEAAAAWRGLAAGYVRKALEDRTLDKDPALNARVDKVMAGIGAAVAAIDSRFARSTWRAILIEGFGHGATAFPGEILLVDAQFVRAMRLGDDELALIFAHEAAHVVSGHAAAKLSFMAQTLGKEQLPDARTALIEFLAKDSYADDFRPTARLQEREADMVGAAIFFASGYDAQRALRLFDKVAALEGGDGKQVPGPHDAAGARKQAIAAVLAKLQQLHARSGPGPQ